MSVKIFAMQIQVRIRVTMKEIGTNLCPSRVFLHTVVQTRKRFSQQNVKPLNELLHAAGASCRRFQDHRFVIRLNLPQS